MEDGGQAVDQARQIKPDVVVLNVSMPVLNGFQAAREIRAYSPRSAIVILSSHADQSFVDEAKKIGVKVYVAKSAVGKALIKAVEAAMGNENFVVLQ